VRRRLLEAKMAKNYPTVSAEYTTAVEKARRKLRGLIAGMLIVLLLMTPVCYLLLEFTETITGNDERSLQSLYDLVRT
jgi:hypothetical protein